MSSRFQRIESPNTSKEVIISTVPVPFEEIPGHDEPVYKPKRFHQYIDQWWIWEIFALLVSCSALAGMIGFLFAVHDHPIPQWHVKGHINLGKGDHQYQRYYDLQITINSILSIFSTILKGTILIPVAASLSQLKWTWFHEGRPLMDFQMFDAANRGPLGSILLIWNLKGRRLACLGAFIIVGTLSLDFAFQQVVTYPIKAVSVQNKALMAIASLYDQYVDQISGGFDPGATGVVASMLGDIYTGTYNLNGTFQTAPTCPTGNCTWAEPYLSLGVCSQCLDATSAIQESCSKYDGDFDYNPDTPDSVVSYCNYSLPNGLSIAGTPSTSDSFFPSLNISSSITNTTRFQQIGTPISVVSLLRADWIMKFVNGAIDQSASDGDNAYAAVTKARATECALFACVKKYNASVENGVFEENLLSTWRNDSRLPDIYSNLSLTPPAHFFEGTTYDNKSSFTITFSGLQAMTVHLGHYWPGNLTAGVPNSLVTGTNPSSDLASFLYSLNTNELTRMMNNLATSMTNNMRVVSGEHAAGVSTNHITYVNVNWLWLALPGVLLGLTLIFLASTMWLNMQQGVPLWKGSTLAAFHHPLTKDGRQKLAQAESPRHLEKVAERMGVRWESTKNGRREADQLQSLTTSSPVFLNRQQHVFPTVPCFVHWGPWDAETRKHPALKWLEDYTVNCIDSRAFDKPHSVWHSDDFSLLKTDGTEIKGGKEAWASVAELFAPFTSHLHQPIYACCTETKYGYEMLAQAWIFANFPGVASVGEQKHKDAQGKEWDMKVPGAFHFEFVKDSEKGFLMQRSELMSDSGPAVLTMLKRGLIKPADLGL